MKTAKLLVILLTAITGAGVIFLSCNKSTSMAAGTVHFQVILTDGPAGYDAVYIDAVTVNTGVVTNAGTVTLSAK